MQRKGIFMHCWWECQVEQTLWKSIGVSSRSKYRTTMWFISTTLEYIEGEF